MNLGKLGARGGFGSLGALGGAGISTPAASPSLDFSDSGNSQYIPIIISATDDPFGNVNPDMMGVRWKKKGAMP